MVENRRCNIFAKPGTGKTCAAIMFLDILRFMGELHTDVPVLAVAPPRVAATGWSKEIAKWDNLREVMAVIPIVGKPEERRAILKLPTDHKRAAIYTISYELLPWLVEELGENWPFRVVIADESHHLRGFRLNQGAKRARAVGRIAHTLVDRWVNLTGTPQPHDGADLWGQMWFVDRGVRLERSYSGFVARYMMYPHPNARRPVMRPGAFEEIIAKIADVCLTVKPPPAPPENVMACPVGLPVDAFAIYHDMERKAAIELKEHGTLAVFNEGGAVLKCMQIANGGVYTERPKWEHIHNSKLEQLDALCGELVAPEPLLIAFEYRFDIEMIKRVLPKAVVLADTTGALEAFMRGEIQHGLAHPASLGEGIDGMQNHCRQMIRYGHNWNLGQREQMLARIGSQRQLALGRTEPVNVWDILADGTVDDVIMLRHTTRRNAMELLMEAFL